MIERILNKAKSFEEARKWDLQQYRSMTREELIAAARVLRRRAYRVEDIPDVRASCLIRSK